jgi:hypothetical protein
VAPAAAAAAPGRSAVDAPRVGLSLVGANAIESRAEPPDVEVAVGAGYVVELVNGAGRIWTTAGSVVRNTSPEELFASTDDLSDPRIVYDSATGRWYATILDLTRHDVLLAVSNGGDPSPGGWSIHEVPTGGCPDQPKIGYGDSLLVVSSDVFASCESEDAGNDLGAQLWVFDKVALIAGQATPAFSYGPDPQYFGFEPSLASGPAVYLLATDGDELDFARVTGTARSALTFTQLAYPYSLANPPEARQPEGTIDSGDSRITSLVWQRNTLFYSAGIDCLPEGGSEHRACAEFGAISSNRIVWHNVLGRTDGDYVYPSIQPDSRGDVFTIAGFSSDSTPPELHAFTLDPFGEFSPPVVLAAGGRSYAGERWGDYFRMTVDPANPDVVWAGGEYGPASGDDPTAWQTQVASLTVAPQPPLAAFATRPVDQIGATTATLHAQVAPQGTPATYHFELIAPVGAGFATESASIAPGTGLTTVSTSLTGLRPGTAYRVVFVATNGAGTTKTEAIEFRTVAPPRARALPVRGSHLGKIKLRFRVTDPSGRARTRISVSRGGMVVFGGTTLGAARPGETYFVTWRPRGARPGPYTFCVEPTSPSGVRGARSCAPLLLT